MNKLYFIIVSLLLFKQFYFQDSNPYDYQGLSGTQVYLLTLNDVYSYLTIDNTANDTKSKFRATLWFYSLYNKNEIKALTQGIYVAFGLGTEMNDSIIFICALTKNLETWCKEYTSDNYILKYQRDVSYTYSNKDLDSSWGNYKSFVKYDIVLDYPSAGVISGTQPMISSYGPLLNESTPNKHIQAFYIRSGDGSKGSHPKLDSNYTSTVSYLTKKDQVSLKSISSRLNAVSFMIFVLIILLFY